MEKQKIRKIEKINYYIKMVAKIIKIYKKKR